jgi:hypothetical protein
MPEAAAGESAETAPSAAWLKQRSGSHDAHLFAVIDSRPTNRLRRQGKLVR